MVLNEIIFYGKDTDGDVVANVREQGKHWARAASQVAMRMQRKHNVFTASHPCGAVDLTGAVMLPRPKHTLLETLPHIGGTARVNLNGAGEEMWIYRKKYDHGLGMKAGQTVSFQIPAGANSLRSAVALDDATPDPGAVVAFTVSVDGLELWRSRPLRQFESQMAHVPLPGKGTLTLSVTGPDKALGNWAGARCTVNDPDSPDSARGLVHYAG